MALPILPVNGHFFGEHDKYVAITLMILVSSRTVLCKEDTQFTKFVLSMFFFNDLKIKLEDIW